MAEVCHIDSAGAEPSNFACMVVGALQLVTDKRPHSHTEVLHLAAGFELHCFAKVSIVYKLLLYTESMEDFPACFPMSGYREFRGHHWPLLRYSKGGHLAISIRHELKYYRQVHLAPHGERGTSRVICVEVRASPSSVQAWS
ncbi:hypothetical protein KIL84_012439 [Mauremys mutica]|uniref:Uncharacterized protein n=1 Tax=Mauremys mutica TaxID=74926 RepID=A0A9D4B7U9_9SAUR|nr:hypothetical protein KIL84_012439 [Mauremys mutica]